MDAVGCTDRRLVLRQLTVDIDVDVLPDHPPFIQHPPGDGRAPLLQRDEHFPDGLAFEIVLACAGEIRERCAQENECHRRILEG